MNIIKIIFTLYIFLGIGCHSNKQNQLNLKWEESFKKHLPSEQQYFLISRYNETQQEIIALAE